MQVYTKSNGQSLKHILWILVILLVAFLPVSSFLFFIKNDAFSGYFPPKFFMSESIHSGYLPLWNPYINFGIPQYADMSSGYWSPITWIIASTVGYNAYSFTVEVLAYIFIAGIGMYKLAGYWNLERKVRFVAAISFMCCGYNVGHMQHFNWLSGTAFLPWCAWGYLLLYQYFSIKNILLAVLLFYLFISSAHPGLIIAASFFFVALAVFLFLRNEDQYNFKRGLTLFVVKNSAFISLLMVLSAGIIVGYSDILPFFSRSGKVPYLATMHNNTTLQSWISFILPFSTTKNNLFFSTDISMRNIYFGLTLFLFFIISLFRKKSAWQLFFLITGLAFLLLAAGGRIAHTVLPLIGYVRLTGEFVVFSIFCFVITAAIELNQIISRATNFKNIAFVYYSFEIVFFLIIALGLFNIINSHQSIFFSFRNVTLQAGLSQKLKWLIDSLTFYDTLIIQGVIQLLLLRGIKFSLQKRNYRFLLRIVMIDLVVATLLNLPFTGVGKASVAQVQAVLNKSPKGIPVPMLQPLHINETINAEEKGLVGDWSFYSKQLGVINQAPYPIQLQNINHYFETNLIDSSLNNSTRPFLFIPELNSRNPLVETFTGSKMKFKAVANDSGMIVLQQAFYPHWVYNRGKEDKQVEEYSSAFIAVPIAKGSNEIEIRFSPAKVIVAMMITLVVLCTIIALLLLNPKFIRRSLFPS